MSILTTFMAPSLSQNSNGTPRNARQSVPIERNRHIRTPRPLPSSPGLPVKRDGRSADVRGDISASGAPVSPTRTAPPLSPTA